MTNSSDAQRLRETPGFRDLAPAVLEALLGKSTKRRIDTGKTLFEAGQPFLDEVYIVRRGKITLQRANGRTEMATPGYLVGLSSYLGDSPYASSAIAGEDTELLVLTARDLREAERREPTLFDAINRLIGTGLRGRSVTVGLAGGGLTQSAASIMTSPLSTCSADVNIRDALQSMLREHVGSLVVVDGAEQLRGMVTFRTLAKRLAEPGVDAALEPVENALQPATTIADDTPLWQAQDVQERDRCKYLVVTQGGRPVGMLSQTDIVHELRAHQSSPYSPISQATNYEELAERYLAIDTVAASALETNRRARVAIRILSETHLAIQRRCVELTLAEHEAEGHGRPPVDYALIIMGSGGRREMMLDPDQDNGFILADHPGTEAKFIDDWFAQFGDRLNVNLDRVGYILCPGDIMARNPMYRKSLSEWKAQITRMTQRPNEKVARWSNIVFDFNAQYGDDALARALRDHLNVQLRSNPGLLKFMTEDDAHGRAPINWFNQLVTTDRPDGMEIVDVKRSGMRIVANDARILALKFGISVCNTTDRIDALVRKGVLSEDFGATVSAAYDELLDILLMHQLAQRRSNTPLDKEVAPQDLPAPAREALRVSMRAVKRFQERIQSEFGGAY
ncbi:MAG: CBS domain-containing protein [Gammaproteobacteria bacterium]|jgi:CBS domain-containing protein|nr:CBS domain-containing protein [Gammaproteobacteria bacterium]NCF83665.1 CBS domain-containing protein [Pseudomonadota bacterium]